VAPDINASNPKTNHRPDNEKELSDEWDVVEMPVVDEKAKEKSDTCNGSKISSQFQLDLGWGSWRMTMFGWDVNIKTWEH
jgi:hypothetical protein